MYFSSVGLLITPEFTIVGFKNITKFRFDRLTLRWLKNSLNPGKSPKIGNFAPRYWVVSFIRPPIARVLPVFTIADVDIALFVVTTSEARAEEVSNSETSWSISIVINSSSPITGLIFKNYTNVLSWYSLKRCIRAFRRIWCIFTSDNRNITSNKNLSFFIVHS